MDYKETLNLPKTAFPMKASLAQREPAMLTFWDELDVYGKLRELRKGQEQFILHDGPPYANGHIHIGHAVNKVLKDIIVKAQGLNGKDAPYVPGWDCHGLPIEINVEKKLGKAGINIEPETFRQKCRDYAASQVDIQRDEFKRLGVFGDWDNPYLTMNFGFEANIIRALGLVIANGHLHKGAKPVHWCMDCGSALAEAEVEYKDKTSPSIDVRFEVLDDEAFLGRLNHTPEGGGEGPIYVPIWTTTPWTLPANQAVALHPQLDYALVQCDMDHSKERLLVAQSMVTDVMERFGVANYRVVAYGQGEALEGLHLQHPFYEREVPIVLGDHVTTEAGTGAVHTAPGHGQDDYSLGIKYNLPIDNPVGGNGCYLPDTPLFAGQHIFKANDSVIEELKTNGKLLHLVSVNHSYPHCWRHKTPVIFLATPQWFISMDQKNLRSKALENIFKVDWIPGWGRERIASMIEGRPDWCISRQRNWGVPIPLFIHKETGDIHPNTTDLIQRVAELVEKDGIDAWFNLKPEDLLGDDAKDYDKISDTLDVWFDSGVTHYCVLDARDELSTPADLYLEGSDQHRGWFQSSMLSSTAIKGEAPYKTVLTHGFTVDAKGHKMSKSLGNVVAPEKVMKTLGADVLRLWVAGTDHKGEMTVSDEILKRTSDTYRRIRNTARFLLANNYDFDPAQHQVPFDDMLELDRWAVDRAYLLQNELIEHYNAYQFHHICQKIHNFCGVDMGSFYLDIIKDRQYTTQTDSLARRSAQTAMYHIIEALSRWFAPILSFTAEEIWKHLPGERDESVFFSTWYDSLATLQEGRVMDQAFWQTVTLVRDAVNKELENVRAAGILGSALEAHVTLYCESELQKTLATLEDELRFVLITSKASLLPLSDKTEDAVATEIEGLHLLVQASPHEKCERCWHRREDVGGNKEHATLCGRCVENIIGKGEQRKFA